MLISFKLIREKQKKSIMIIFFRCAGNDNFLFLMIIFHMLDNIPFPLSQI